jgi:hypothetical protein
MSLDTKTSSISRSVCARKLRDVTFLLNLTASLEWRVAGTSFRLHCYLSVRGQTANSPTRADSALELR